MAKINFKGFQGLDFSKPASQIDSRRTQHILNVRVDREQLRFKRPGIRQYGNGPLDGGAQLLYLAEFKKLNGTIYRHCGTKDITYYYSAGTWTPITPTVTWTGAVTDYFGHCAMLDSQYISQGVDVIHCSTGNGQFAPVDGGGKVTQLPAARYLEQFADRIVAAYTTETVPAAGTFEYRVRWCVNGVPNNWDDTGAGYNDLIDTPDFITGLKKQGNLLFVYKESNIIQGSKTGSATQPFAWAPFTNEVGLIAPRSLVAAGDKHIFLSSDNVYIIEGTTLSKLWGERVRARMFERLNPTYISLACGMWHKETNEYWLLVTENSALEYVWACTLDGKEPVRYRITTSKPSLLATPGLVGSTDGYVDDIFEDYLDDMIAGTAKTITGIWETPDITLQDEQKNLHMFSAKTIAVTYSSTTGALLKVSYSWDGGNNYEDLGDIILSGGEHLTSKLGFMQTGHIMRFRFQNVEKGVSFNIKEVEVEYEPRGEYIP